MENIIETVEQPVEQIYRYQPTDENGNRIGGEQVIKYTTQDELVTKLREQNTLLIRKLRQETKNNRLGVHTDEVLPEGIQKFNNPLEFTPRDLSDDERYDISRRLLDPTTASDAASALIEARLGAPLDRIGQTLQSVQQDNISLRAKVEANSFVAENPDYYKCKENFESITSWIVRYNLAPVKDNFQKAYDTLKAQGVLIDGPGVIEIIPPAVIPPVVEQVIPVVPEQVRVPGLSTGLTRESASDSGIQVKTGSDITYQIGSTTLTGLAAINAMPGEEYKRRLLGDKEFAKKVEKLESEARKPRG